MELTGNEQRSKFMATSEDLGTGLIRNYDQRDGYWRLALRLGVGARKVVGRGSMSASLAGSVISTEEGSWLRRVEILPVLFALPMLRVGYQWSIG